jgi:two-component system response regulator
MKPILQVEDDPNDVFLFQHAMKRMGVARPVQVAQDGQEAINYVQGVGKFADRVKFPMPCLVLLDLKLPYVMGLEVLRCIRKQPGPPLPVIMLTASGENSDISAAYRLGANAFLTKPSEASKLQEMVKSINDFWLTHNTLPDETLPDSASEAPMEGVVSLGYFATAAPAPAPVNGARREDLLDRLEVAP